MRIYCCLRIGSSNQKQGRHNYLDRQVSDGDSMTISLGNSDGDDKLLNLNGQVGRTSNLGKEKATVLGKHRLPLYIGTFHFRPNFIQK